MIIIVGALAAAGISAMLVPLVRAFARATGVVDNPHIDPARRIHHTPIPLLGGFAIGMSLVVGILLFGFFESFLTAQYVRPEYLYSLVAAIVVIMIGGYLDDRYQLSPRYSILFPLLAALIMIASGIGVHFITNPFGGVWRIDQIKIPFSLGGFGGIFNVGVSAFTLVWLMGIMYTTKLLDGLDGLVSGVTGIAAAVLVFLSLAPPVLQYDTALLAALVAGAFLGFLPYNWSPASIFLGEGGSILAGFMLGVLSIVAGGKIATTLLVIGIPALDVVWVLGRRLFWEHRSIHVADRKHLHFRLRDSGLGTKKTVLLYYAATAAFGVIALSSRSMGKFISLLALILLMIVIAIVVVRTSRTN